MQRFPAENRIVTFHQFKTVLMSLIDSEPLYERLARQCAFACSSSTDKKKEWMEKVVGGDPKTHIANKILSLSPENMFVNVNYLLRYLE